MKINVIGETNFPDIAGAEEKYTIIELRERVTIHTEALENVHQYWVKSGMDIHNEDNYFEPLNDPDFNLRSDYELYRKSFNFLSPDEIKDNRNHLGLTLREAATVLAISYATLSNIENGLVLQSYSQETKLRFMDNITRFCDLAETHKSLIAQKKGIDVDRLFNKLRRDKAEEITSFGETSQTICLDNSYMDEAQNEGISSTWGHISDNSFTEGGYTSWKNQKVYSRI